jgi:predicted Mrr-cat superfamily restriction endonuclease
MPELSPEELQTRVAAFVRNVDVYDAIDAGNVFLPLLGELLNHEGYDLMQISNGVFDRGWDIVAGRSDEPERERVAVEYKHLRNRMPVKKVHEVLGKVSQQPFERFLLISRAGFTQSAIDEITHSLPIRVELLTLDQVRQWAEQIATPPPPPPSRVQSLVAQFSAELAKAVAKDPRALDSIEWRDLERLLAVVLDALGFEAELTPPAKDGGKDIILRISDRSGALRSFIVEIKHWRSGKRVGSTIVSDFVQAVAHEQHEAGLILATYGFASSATAALTEVDRTRVRFGQESKIAALCRTYVRSQVGLWSPLDGDDLAEMLLADTLWRTPRS